MNERSPCSVGITLTLEDFQAVSDKTPFLVGSARYYSPRHPKLWNLRLLRASQTDSGALRSRQLPTPQSRVTLLPPFSPRF